MEWNRKALENKGAAFVSSNVTGSLHFLVLLEWLRFDLSMSLALLAQMLNHRIITNVVYVAEYMAWNSDYHFHFFCHPSVHGDKLLGSGCPIGSGPTEKIILVACK